VARQFLFFTITRVIGVFILPLPLPVPIAAAIQLSMAALPFLTDPFMVAAVVLLLAAPVVFLFLRGRKPWLARLRRKPLLTPNEVEFLYRLQRALPRFHVFPQVSFAAFLTDDGQLSRNAQWAVRAKFDRKIADFVVCERGTFRIVAVVELDDRTHDARADRQRDAITRAAGYQTIRYQSRQKPSESEIAALFQHARAWVSE
jgi:hypothetical protein